MFIDDLELGGSVGNEVRVTSKIACNNFSEHLLIKSYNQYSVVGTNTNIINYIFNYLYIFKTCEIQN